MPADSEAKFACPSCGRSYAWKPQLAGKHAKCKCGAALAVPARPPGAADEFDPPALNDDDFPPEAPAEAAAAPAPAYAAAAVARPAGDDARGRGGRESDDATTTKQTQGLLIALLILLGSAGMFTAFGFMVLHRDHAEPGVGRSGRGIMALFDMLYQIGGPKLAAAPLFVVAAWFAGTALYVVGRRVLGKT
jgi:hypothetical protein